MTKDEIEQEIRDDKRNLQTVINTLKDSDLFSDKLRNDLITIGEAQIKLTDEILDYFDQLTTERYRETLYQDKTNRHEDEIKEIFDEVPDNADIKNVKVIYEV